jgi:hypothetical protein
VVAEDNLLESQPFPQPTSSALNAGFFLRYRNNLEADFFRISHSLKLG